MGLDNQSVEVLIGILQYLSLGTAINIRLVSRFFDDLILVNLPYLKPLDPDMSDALISRLLHHKILNDRDILAQVERIAKHINPTLAMFQDQQCAPHKLLDQLCDALTFFCGRRWVIDNIKRPLDWSDDWGNDETMVLAAWLGRSRTVKGLLASGRNVNLRHEYLGSLMYAAAFNDDGHLTDALLERGMKLQYAEGAYGDPLQLAAYRGASTVVESLLYSGITLLANARSVGYGPFGSPLGAAAAAGHANLIGTLTCSLQSSEIVGPESKTPLHYAACNGHAHAVAELLGTEIDVDLTDNDDHTALELAAREGHVDVVNAFLDGLSSTPMHFASAVHNSMALQYAAWFGHKDVVQILTDRSLAQPQTCNGDLPPAIFCAALRGHFQVVDILLASNDDERIDFEHQTMPHTLLTRLAESGSVSMLRHILASSQVDVNKRDAKQDTALHVACKFNRPRVVQALLENKDLNPNLVDAEGLTALDIALHEKYDEAVAMLTADDRVDE